MVMQPLHGHVGAVAPVNVEPVQPRVLLARGGKPPCSDVGGDGLREQVSMFGQRENPLSSKMEKFSHLS